MTTGEGTARLGRGDPAGALDAFREALDAEPGDLDAWRGTVRAALALRLWAEVVRALDRVLSLASDKAELAAAHVLRGQVLDREQGDPAGAGAHYERSLVVLPDQVWPYLALAELDLRGRRWSRAIAHADHGLEFAPPDAAERPWLLLVKAIASERVSTSLGPQSVFFQRLRGGSGPDAPGEAAYLQARARVPALAGLSYRAWLEDAPSAVRFVGEHMPRPALSA